jgi:glycosyltransferase involved in cell wall biosynthesis
LAKKITIVLQTRRDPHSSVLLTYQALSAELARRGYAVSIRTPEDFPAARRFAGRLTPILYPIAVASWMRRQRASLDIVVFHSYAGWLAAATGATGRTAVVVSFHGVEPMYHRELLIETSGRLSRRYRFLQERLMPMFLKTACRRAARVTCLNRAERNFLVEQGWASAERVVTVAHGVHDRFFLEPRAPRPVRTLLFVAQWLPIKGIETLRAAYTDLARRHPALSLVCAGTLFAADHVKAGFPADVRDRVTVLPRVDHPKLVDVYRDADVFVFPSNYEGFGVAVLEAMAAGLPVVATSTGVAGDALVDRESAIMVPPRDPAALVRAIDALISDAALRSRVGAGARASAETYRHAARITEWADALTTIDRVS